MIMMRNDDHDEGDCDDIGNDDDDDDHHADDDDDKVEETEEGRAMNIKTNTQH